MTTQTTEASQDLGTIDITLYFLDRPGGVRVRVPDEQELLESEILISNLRQNAELMVLLDGEAAKQQGEGLLKLAEAEEAALNKKRQLCNTLMGAAKPHTFTLRIPPMDAYEGTLNLVRAALPEGSEGGFDLKMAAAILPIALGVEKVQANETSLFLWQRLSSILFPNEMQLFVIEELIRRETEAESVGAKPMG